MCSAITDTRVSEQVARKSGFSDYAIQMLLSALPQPIAKAADRQAASKCWQNLFTGVCRDCTNGFLCAGDYRTGRHVGGFPAQECWDYLEFRAERKPDDRERLWISLSDAQVLFQALAFSGRGSMNTKKIPARIVKRLDNIR